MGEELHIVSALHSSGVRDYAARRNDLYRADNATFAKQFGVKYWDGDRRFGYGGYHYDGRWQPIAEQLIERYRLQAGDAVLDVGCGKAHLLYEMTRLQPALRARGLDISEYALACIPEKFAVELFTASATKMPIGDRTVDFVMSLATLHNLSPFGVRDAIEEINRVLRDDVRAYITVESWNTEQQRMNLLDWQLTCQTFLSTNDWRKLFDECGYRGDYEFLVFD